MKKRGFGEGKWNGPGGKLQEGETIEQACCRETHEEIGVSIITLEDRGVVRFVFEGKPTWDNECHIYVATEIRGEPVESEEMKPAWYPIDEIPLQDMWEDDSVWLKDVLAGGSVNATFFFDSNGKMTGYDIS
jgi:ADP-ribose pyrophosphatase YjhB (NUDIX family)